MTVLLLLTVTAGCGHADDTGRLRAEHITSAQPPGTARCSNDSQPGGQPAGKPNYPTLTRTCSLNGDAKPDQVLHDTVDLAVADGWAKPTEAPSDGGAWLLTKPDMELQLSIRDRWLIMLLVDQRRFGG